MSISFTWQPTSSPNVNFTTVSCSDSGAVIAACVENGYIYVSSDSGLTWTQCTAAGSRAWRSIVVSGDGTLIAAGDTTGYIYVSINVGVSWDAKTAAGSRYWFALASSADGSRLVAGVTSGGYIYTSSDYGATWTERTAAGARSWSGLWSSSSGSYIIAVTDGGYIYTSSDYGATWTERTAAGVRSWWSVSASDNAQKIVASVAWGGSVYTSADSGTTWSASPSTDVLGSHAVAISSDGSTMLVANGSLWSSEDSGSTWLEQGAFSDCYEFAASTDLDYLYANPLDAGIDSGVKISTSGITFLFESAVVVPELDANVLFSEVHYQSNFITSLAWPELSGSITAGDNYSASLMVSGSGVLLDATIDSATAVLTVAPITFEATLLMGFVADLEMSSASAGIDAMLDVPTDAGASMTVSGITLDASFLTGSTFSFSTTAAAANLSTSYLLGSLFSAAISTAGIKLSSGNLASDLIYGGSLVAVMPWLAVDLRLAGGGTTEVWLVNARTQGMAQYSNYPFQAFAMLSNGLLLAGAADGLYLTDSATDAGKEIAGIVEIGASDMGSGSVKYVPDAVLDCEGSGDLVLSVISDGGTVRGYSATIDHQGLQQNKRFKLAKGIKSRYWSARLSLPVGVSVTSLELKPVATRRTA